MKKFGNTMVAVGPEGDEATQGLQRAGRAARDPLVAESGRQLGHHRRRAHLEALAGQAGRRANGWPRKSARSAIRRKIPLPVDISITADGKGLWVNTFMDGKTRYFDLTNPEAPKQTYEKVTGKQVNMISPELGRQARLHHVVAARQLGQGRRRQRAVRARVSLGRQGAEAGVRGGLHQGEAGPRAPHEVQCQDCGALM